MAIGVIPGTTGIAITAITAVIGNRD